MIAEVLGHVLYEIIFEFTKNNLQKFFEEFLISLKMCVKFNPVRVRAKQHHRFVLTCFLLLSLHAQ